MRFGKAVFRRTFLPPIITLAVMVFIFVQSAMTADVSGAESGPVAVVVAQVMERAVQVARPARPVSFAVLVNLAERLVRKAAHFLEFLALGASLIATVRSVRPSLPLPRTALAAWLTGAAYAVSDEVHQRFVPGRSGQVTDVVLDAAGVLAGVGIACLVLRLVSRRRESPGAPRS